MKKMNIINSFTTPDEWKERAKKIPEGRKHAATVKSYAPLKIMIAAAAAIAVGIAGFNILRGSNEDMIPPYEPAPTQKTDENASKNYNTRQLLSMYYPKSSDYAINRFFERYSNSGTVTFLTNRGGYVKSRSTMLIDSVSEVKDENLNICRAECDGYVMGDNKVSVLIRLDNISTYMDTKDLAQIFSPYVSVVRNDTGEQIEREVDVSYSEGFMAQYVRVDISYQGEELSLYDLTIDIHMYGDDTGLDTVHTADELMKYDSGAYHYDIRVKTSGIAELPESDAFDTVLRYLGSESAPYPLDRLSVYELSPLYREFDGAVTFADDPAFQKGDNNSITDRAYFNEAENNSIRTYVKSVSITCDGIITDGVNAYLLFKEASFAQSGIEALNENLSIKAYLADTGEELSLLGTPLTFRDESLGCNRLIIRLKPDNLLFGRGVQLHIISDEEQYGSDSYHYVFDVNFPAETAVQHNYSNELFAYSDENIHLDKSCMGALIVGCNELVEEKISSAERDLSAAVMYIEGDRLSSGSYDLDGQYRGVVFNDALTTDRGECRLTCVKDKNGDTAGYYISYNSVDGDVYRVLFYDEA